MAGSLAPPSKRVKHIALGKDQEGIKYSFAPWIRRVIARLLWDGGAILFIVMPSFCNAAITRR
jgi:hypothetical protein